MVTSVDPEWLNSVSYIDKLKTLQGNVISFVNVVYYAVLHIPYNLYK